MRILSQFLNEDQNFETNRSHSLKYKEVSLSFRYLYSECSVLLMALEVIEKVFHNDFRICDGVIDFKCSKVSSTRMVLSWLELFAT